MASLLMSAGLRDAVALDSAGTGGWHQGERPDKRSQAAAKRRGITLPGTAQKFTASHFDRYDYVVAMDKSNRENLLRLARTEDDRAKISLLRSFDPESEANADVPDPYYGSGDGFERVLDICEAGCVGLLAHLRDEHSI